MVNFLFLQDKSAKSGEYTSKIAARLPRDWNIHLVSIFNKKVDLGRDYKFECIFDHPIFSKKLSEEEIIKAERWLGYPFPLLLKSYYYYEDSGGKKKSYRQFLAQLVYFWKEYFTKNKIDIYFPPYECDYLHTSSYEVAKKFNIPIAIVSLSRIGKSLVFLNSDLEHLYYKKITKEEIEKYPKLVAKYFKKEGKPIDTDAWSDYAEKFHKNRLKMIIPRLKAYWDFVIQYNKKSKFNKLSNPSPWTLFVRYLRRNIRGFIGPFFYQKADTDKNFFLFPLFYYDEAANSYHYAMFDQYDVIKTVSKALPSDQLLYVKPHPHFNCNDIPIKKIRELRKLNNVRFISPNTNAHKLIEKCIGVITIGATTGFEAMVFDKPVIVFGDPFYAENGTVVFVKDVRDLPYIIENVINIPNYGITKGNRNAFIAKYYKHLIFPKKLIGFDLIFSDEDAQVVADELVKIHRFLYKNDKPGGDLGVAL